MPPKSIQTGTGLHVDTNGYNPYAEEQDERGDPSFPTQPLPKWFPLQALIALSDHSDLLEDGGLEVVPGMHVVCEEFFTLLGRDHPNRNFQRWGRSITKFLPGVNDDVISLVQPVRRIPADWEVERVAGEGKEGEAFDSKEALVAHVRGIGEELRGFLPGEAIRRGDYVIWDNRLPHQSANRNETEEIRRVMYLTYLPQVAEEGCRSRERVEKQRGWREVRVPPPDFQQDWKELEAQAELLELNHHGRLVWGYDEFDPSEEAKKQRWEEIQRAFPLDQRSIEFFKRYGYVVIPNTVSQEQVTRLNQQVNEHITKHSPITFDNLAGTLTVKNWLKVSCRFGGMLNAFYLQEMDQIRQSFACYAAQAQLLAQTYAPGSLPLFETGRLGAFDPTALNLRVDRLNFRIPDRIFSMAEGSQ